MGKVRQGEKGKGQTAYTRHGRRLELWLTGEPGEQGMGTELGELSTYSCYPRFIDLSCSQGTSIALHWPHPCGHRVVRCSTLQASGSQ